MNKAKTECELLEDISAKMDKILASLVIAGREQNDQIKILKAFDFDWKEIGMMVGLSADAARMRFNAVKAGEKQGGQTSKRGGKYSAT